MPPDARNTSLRGAKNALRGKSLKKLSDDELLTRLEKLRGNERAVLVEILKYLNEVERRRLYVPRGYASLYEFCTDYLKYSRSAAMRRIHAARCIGRFPRVAGHLLCGELSLTVVSMISRILTKENAEEILAYSRGRSTREIEMLVSRHRPDFMLRDRVRPICLMVPEVVENGSFRITGAGKNLSQPVDNASDKNRDRCAGSEKLSQGDNPAAGGLSIRASGDGGGDSSGQSDSPPETGSAVDVSSGSESKSECVERVRITRKFKVEFAVDPEFMEKLGKIKSLLSTKYPAGMNFEILFTILMQEYLDRHSPEERLKRRNARKDRTRQRNNALESNNIQSPRKKTSGRDRNPVRMNEDRSRYIPQEVNDEIFTRDGGQCTFIGPDGNRCDSRWNLQLDHIIPFAKGGKSTQDNKTPLRET